MSVETRWKNNTNSVRQLYLYDGYDTIPPYKEKKIHFYRTNKNRNINNNKEYILLHEVGRPDEIYTDTDNNTIYLTERKDLTHWIHAIGQLYVYKSALESKYEYLPINERPTIKLILECYCDEPYDHKVLVSCDNMENAIFYCSKHDIHLRIYKFDNENMMDWRMYLSIDKIEQALINKGIISANPKNLSSTEIYALSRYLKTDDFNVNDIMDIFRNRGIEININNLNCEIDDRCITHDREYTDKINDFINHHFAISSDLRNDYLTKTNYNKIPHYLPYRNVTNYDPNYIHFDTEIHPNSDGFDHLDTSFKKLNNDIPKSVDELDTYNYRDLQYLAKKLNIPAKKKANILYNLIKHNLFML